MTKRILSLVLALMLAFAFAGCAKEEAPAEAVQEAPAEVLAEEAAEAPAEEPVGIRIGGLTGPTTMGLVSLVEKAEAGQEGYPYEFTIAGSADEITPLLIQGELDMAAIPANLASVLYNKTEGQIVLLGINTLGVLYILDNSGEVASLADLKGKTIYATGKGSTPEYTLRHILSANGIDPDADVTIEWKSEPQEVVALLAQNKGVAMMPQPFVTVARGSVEGLEVVVDLTEEWEKLGEGSLITGVMAARKDFVEAHPEAVKDFLQKYAESVAFTNNNAAEAAQLIEKYGIVKAAVAEKAIPFCNIVCETGSGAMETAKSYLTTLFEQNPKAVGGALPGEDFYYAGE